MSDKWDSPEGQTMSVYTLIDRLEERIKILENNVSVLIEQKLKADGIRMVDGLLVWDKNENSK